MNAKKEKHALMSYDNVKRQVFLFNFAARENLRKFGMGIAKLCWGASIIQMFDNICINFVRTFQYVLAPT